MLMEVFKILCKRGLFNKCFFLFINNKIFKGKLKIIVKKFVINII